MGTLLMLSFVRLSSENIHVMLAWPLGVKDLKMSFKLLVIIFLVLHVFAESNLVYLTIKFCKVV